MTLLAASATLGLPPCSGASRYKKGFLSTRPTSFYWEKEFLEVPNNFGHLSGRSDTSEYHNLLVFAAHALSKGVATKAFAT